jgi:hypothetical protein
MKTLKLIAKILLLTLGSVLILPTIVLIFVDDTPDKWYAIIPIILFGFPMIYLGLKIKIEPKPIIVKPIDTNEKVLVNHFKEIQQETKVENFNLNDFKVANIRTKLYQLLESLEIISSSINVDIVIGRHEFINKIIPDLIKYKSLDLYKKYFLEVIEEYKTRYFDRVISKEQIYFCTNPDDENNLIEYYANNIMRAYKSTVDNHIEAINGMKQKKAIIGRYEKIMTISEMAKDTIKALPRIEKRNNYLEEIFEIRRDASIKKDIL